MDKFKNFDAQFAKSSKSFERGFRRMKILIALLVLLSLAGIGVWVFAFVKAARYVEHNGLKSVVQQVWNGNPDAR
jgi:ABC-type phosphate transport system permease subunit